MSKLTFDKAEMQNINASFNTPEESEPLPPGDIVSFNELRSCFDLYRLFDTGKLEIQPDFQREVVWRHEHQTRFIDSLVKQLPIPSMCFGLDYNTKQWIVIDGLQRMSSIINFLSPKPWRLKNLEDIHPLLRGQRNVDLRNGRAELSILYGTVEDVSIPITILRCDFTKSSHMNYLFTIFHRLNSGGARLNNQEIRNCIYYGPLNDFLKSFDNQNTDWSSVKKKLWGGARRFRSVELLLRVIALYERSGEYEGNLAKFLNDFMHMNSKMDGGSLAEIHEMLDKMALAAKGSLSRTNTKVSLTYIEAALVGILHNLRFVSRLGEDDLVWRFQNLVEKLYEEDLARYAVASEAKVFARIELAKIIYGK